MYRIIIFVLFFSFTCKKETKKNIEFRKKIETLPRIKVLPKGENCLEIEFNFEHKRSKGFSLVKFNVKQLKFELLLVDGSEKSFLRVNNNLNRTHFNFTYDTDKETSISEIKIFSCKENEFIILLPTATEELALYQMIKIDRKSKIEDLGLISYKTADLDSLFKTDVVGKIESIGDKYIYKLEEKTSGNEMLIYDEVNIEHFNQEKKIRAKVDTYLNLRSSTDLKKSKIIAKVYPNDKMILLNDFGEWSLVFSKNIYGYLSNDFIEKMH